MEVIRYDDARSLGDVFRIDACEVTPEGWRRIPATIGRGDCVLPYRRADGSIQWEFRPASEVTDPASVASFEALPVTNDHPPVHLDCDNVKAYKVGQSGTARADGVLVKSNLLVDDKRTNADIDSGKRQISPGYRVNLDYTPGVFQGQHYDAVQRDIRGNHIAIVPLGRQGPEVALRTDSSDAVLAFDLLPTPETQAMPNVKQPENKTDMGDKEYADMAEKVMDALMPKMMDAMSAKLDEMMAPMKESMDRVDMMGKRLDEMSGMLGKMKPVENEDTAADPKVDGAESKMDAETRAKLDSLEAQVKRQDEERARLDAKYRADMAEAELRADVLADARRIIGDDYTGAGKTRIDIMGDVVLKVDGDDSKPAIERERSNVRSDSPASEAEFHGYVKARYESALSTHRKRLDASEGLLAAAKNAARTDGEGEREDKAAIAKADADAKKKDRWKQGFSAT